MRIIEIALSRSVRVNTGNYEGTEIFCSVKAELDELDDMQEVRTTVKAALNEALLDDLTEHYRLRGQSDRMTLEAIRRRHGV